MSIGLGIPCGQWPFRSRICRFVLDFHNKLRHDSLTWANVAPARPLDRDNIGAGHAGVFPNAAMTVPLSRSDVTICAGDERLEKRRVFIVPKEVMVGS